MPMSGRILTGFSLIACARPRRLRRGRRVDLGERDDDGDDLHHGRRPRRPTAGDDDAPGLLPSRRQGAAGRRGKFRRPRRSRGPRSTSSPRARPHPRPTSGYVGRSVGISGVTIENGVAKLDGEVPSLPHRPRAGRLHADAVPHGQAGRDRRRSSYTRARLRGRDAEHPRRVAARVRDGVEPDPRDRHGEHVRGDVRLRGRRPWRQGVDKNFVTATSGTGTRGTFDFTTKPYTGKAGEGALVVFELSAKDGSRTKEVRIPVQLEP